MRVCTLEAARPSVAVRGLRTAGGTPGVPSVRWPVGHGHHTSVRGMPPVPDGRLLWGGGHWQRVQVTRKNALYSDWHHAETKRISQRLEPGAQISTGYGSADIRGPRHVTSARSHTRPRPPSTPSTRGEVTVMSAGRLGHARDPPRPDPGHRAPGHRRCWRGQGRHARVPVLPTQCGREPGPEWPRCPLRAPVLARVRALPTLCGQVPGRGQPRCHRCFPHHGRGLPALAEPLAAAEAAAQRNPGCRCCLGRWVQR